MCNPSREEKRYEEGNKDEPFEKEDGRLKKEEGESRRERDNTCKDKDNKNLERPKTPVSQKGQKGRHTINICPCPCGGICQQAGGPIGLRATCAVAGTMMNFWDAKTMEAMNNNNIKRDLEDGYMDDIRIILMSLKEDRRWLEDGLY